MSDRLQYLRNCTEQEREDEGTQGEYEELEAKVSDFDQFQKVVIESYNDGDHQVESTADVPDCGDGLLKFLLTELSEGEDCDSFDCAVQRIDMAIRQLTSLQSVFETKALDAS